MSLTLIVPFACAAFPASAAVTPLFTTTSGPITSITPSGLTVQANAELPTSCTRRSSSPAVRGYKVGELITIACTQGVLASISMGRGQARGPLIAISGLEEGFNIGLPVVPGPTPTGRECAAAWNANAPPAARRAIGSLRPLAVRVTTAVEGVSSSAGSVSMNGPICVISFVLRGTRTAEVTSVWKRGTARGWRGFISKGYPHLLITHAGFSVSPTGTLNRGR